MTYLNLIVDIRDFGAEAEEYAITDNTIAIQTAIEQVDRGVIIYTSQSKPGEVDIAFGKDEP